jgi:DNA (cytosine-5)-methyltransferase 1
MTFIDLFAGVGGFRRGMELAGHKCMGFCEWDKFAAASYTSMHLITDEQRQKLAGMSLKERQKEILKDEYRNGEWYSPDIRQVGAGNVPRVDCWCFGAPCQDFSFAGKRAGLDGDRSSLVREVFRALGELEEKDRPEWLIYENVKGMLSSNRGGDFLSIILAMEELGYDIEWQVFNSKYHGVPQNRERVYTLGHLRARGERKVFPLRGAAEEDSTDIEILDHYGREQHTAIPMCVGGIDKGNKKFGKQFAQQDRIYDGSKVATALTTRNNANGVGNVNQDGTAVCIPVLTRDRAEKRQNGRRFKDDGEEAFTLTSQDKHGVALGVNTETDGTSRTIKAQYAKNSLANFIRTDSLGATGAMQINCQSIPCIWYEKYGCYIAIRKLTPKECFRLQSFSDEDFAKAQFVNSDSQLYKQAGNSVTVNVVYDIAKATGETYENKRNT